MISKADGVNDNFLRVQDLEIGTEYSKIGYLLDYKSSMSKLEKGYYVFYIKDYDGNIVVATLHNIANFLESGGEALKLKRKPVKIKFLATEFNGSVSLLVTQIEDYTDIGFPFANFIGRVENVENSITAVNAVLQKVLGNEKTLDSRYATATLDGIYNSKCGGYAKLLEMVIYDLIACQELPNIDFKILLEVFYEVQKAYFLQLTAVSKSDLIRRGDNLDIIMNAQIANNESDLKPVITDCLTTLFGLTESSEQLYAVLISESFQAKRRILDMTGIYSTMILGAEKKYGELKLVKY